MADAATAAQPSDAASVDAGAPVPAPDVAATGAATLDSASEEPAAAVQVWVHPLLIMDGAWSNPSGAAMPLGWRERRENNEAGLEQFAIPPPLPFSRRKVDGEEEEEARASP